MIIRLVKMTFRADGVADFEQLFEKHHLQIRKFPGCTHLQLLRDGNVFFTYSHWNSAHDLEKYRNSALFKTVWPATKALFEKPAEAWSTEQLYYMP